MLRLVGLVLLAIASGSSYHRAACRREIFSSVEL